jgi:endogenous inhibitor of DNA gyrase (YacG/DUF329 family)
MCRTSNGLSLDARTGAANIGLMTDDPKPAGPDPAAVRVTAAKCLRCGAPVVARYRPFCSQRCADIDLGKWVSGTYRIATHEDASGPDEDSER